MENTSEILLVTIKEIRSNENRRDIEQAKPREKPQNWSLMEICKAILEDEIND